MKKQKNVENPQEFVVDSHQTNSTQAENAVETTSKKQKPAKKEKVVKTNTSSQKTSARILSIDRFRGLCMFVMVISFFMGAMGDTFAKWAPIFEHGAKGFQILPGVAFADIFAPMFIFVIGLTYVKSFKSREAKYGTKVAYWQTAVRYLGLMGIGALLNGFEDGWMDVFQGKAFASLDVRMKIFSVSFFIALALIIPIVVSLFVKNEKFKSIAASMLRYFLAIMGVFVLFYIIVSTAEGIGQHYEGAFVGNIYGKGWIWDTLQNIGLAGLLALPFVKMDKWGKLIMVAIAFTVMTIFAQNGGIFLMDDILEGGLFGAVSWAGILLLGSVFIEIKDDKIYWVLASLMLLLSVILVVAFNFSAVKRGCTPVYAMFTASLAAFVFAGIDALNRFKSKFAFFSWWGGSALFVYVVNYLLCLALGAIFEVTNAVLPIWAGVLVVIGFLALYSVANWLLYRKGKHIRL